MGEHFSTQTFAGRPARRVLTDEEVLNANIDRMLRKYRQALADNTHDYEACYSAEPIRAKTFAAAMRRNEKSIALWTAKRLCEHEIVRHAARINSSTYPVIRCNKCTSTVTRK